MGIVVVLGSLIADLVARAPRMPLPGESLVGNDFNTFLGGKGINQAVTAARLGAQVTLIGRVGTDTYGDGFFPILDQEGINNTYVSRDDKVGTGVSLVIIAENSGQNMIVANPRANLIVSAQVVEKALNAVQQERASSKHDDEKVVFLTQCETSKDSYTTGLKQARALGFTTILNAAPIPVEPFDDELYRYLDVLIVNEVEATVLSQVTVNTVETAQRAAEIFLTRGPRHVIVTLGAQGALWSTTSLESNSPIHRFLPPIPVQGVDATAAGDAFCGALAASLAAERAFEEALQVASAAGAVTASRPGAIAALPYTADIQQLLSNSNQEG